MYGDSLQSYLVMIVVPDGEEVAKFAGHAPPTGAADYAGVAKVLGGAAAPKLAAAVRAQVVGLLEENRRLREQATRGGWNPRRQPYPQAGP